MVADQIQTEVKLYIHSLCAMLQYLNDAMYLKCNMVKMLETYVYAL